MRKTVYVLIAFCISTLALNAGIVTGAEQTSKYVPLLKGKRVGIVTNHTSMIGNTHIVDSLHSLGVNIVYIFAPEHGFRGKQSAGAHIKHDVDAKTGIKIFSLHGATKAPTKQCLDEIDIMIFDIQDVGLRFYTYISTMYYIMSTAIDNNKEVIILDRPNPNIYYVDGPILDMKHKSFVGMYPIPVVHGMTVCELAIMANEEGWINKTQKCKLTTIEMQNYNRRTMYSLPIAPSPNLPNDISIQLYANLCLFEATTVSVGRGTENPFQQYGSPTIKGYDYNFTPKSMSGATNPPQNGKKCYGVLLTSVPKHELYSGDFSLKYIIDAYNKMGKPEKFFNSFLEKLIGVDYVRKMIHNGNTAEEISKMWKPDIKEFKIKRQKYLIYER